jgi:hypothetical protein
LYKSVARRGWQLKDLTLHQVPVPLKAGRYARLWPIASISQFGPGPLLVKPDMAELRLLDLETEREGSQHVGELHGHHAQRERHADGSFQIRGGSEYPDN